MDQSREKNSVFSALTVIVFAHLTYLFFRLIGNGGGFVFSGKSDDKVDGKTGYHGADDLYREQFERNRPSRLLHDRGRKHHRDHFVRCRQEYRKKRSDAYQPSGIKPRRGGGESALRDRTEQPPEERPEPSRLACGAFELFTGFMLYDLHHEIGQKYKREELYRVYDTVEDDLG